MLDFVKRYIEEHIDELEVDVTEFLRTMHVKVICVRHACAEIVDTVEEARIPIKEARIVYIHDCIKKYLLNTFWLTVTFEDIFKNLGNCCGLSRQEVADLVNNFSDDWLELGFNYSSSDGTFYKSIDEESDMHF